MADRYNEDVERGWRDEDRRSGRYGGEADQDRGRGYQGYENEGRSFSPRREFERDRSGGDFTGPRYGAGGYTGYGDRQFGERGYGERNYSTGYLGGEADRYGGQWGQGPAGGQYGNQGGGQYGAARYDRPRGGRYYGDDGREPVYREEYGEGRPGGYGASRYDQAFQDRREGHSEFGFGYDLSGRSSQDSRGSQDQDRGFWGRRGREMFGLGEGAHRGRGPQGYKRSDERINEDVHERLTDDPHIDASGIVVAVKDGEVTLSGTVESRDAKHHAEHLVEHLNGVKHVQNNLRVDEHGGQRGATGSTAAGATTTAANPLGENTKLSEQAAGKA